MSGKRPAGDYDAVIIGAGILGAAVAAFLAEAGWRVLILDRGKAAGGASGGNLGQISISDRTEPWHMPLAVESQHYYLKMQAGQADIEYVPSGGAVVLKGDEQIAAGQRACRNMAALGVDAALYFDSADIRKIEPHIDLSSLDAIVYCPLEAKLNPLLTTIAFLDLAKQAGAELLRDTPVDAFVIDGGRIEEVVTPAGRFCGRFVVNCAGPRANFVAGLAGLSLPILFHKGTALVSEPVAPTINGPLVGGGFFLDPPAVRPARHIGFGTVQSVSGSILIAQSTEECPSDDRSVNMPSLCLIAERFLRHFPQLRGLQIVRAWAAVTTYTPDDLPVFGPSGQLENFFTVAGFKGAFSVAPAVGRITRDALLHGLDPAYERLSPDRNHDLVTGAVSGRKHGP